MLSCCSCLGGFANAIVANTAVLFPSSPNPLIEGNPYEIVYASKAREGEDENPWVRFDPLFVESSDES